MTIRKRAIHLALTCAATLLIAAFGSASFASASQASAQEFKGQPIKIGFLDTMTGTFANVGKLNLQGAQIAVEQWNAKGGVLGRKIELVVKDEQLSPRKTVQAMREFASADINMITGFTSSADVLAAKPIAERRNMVIVTAGATDTSLTTTKSSRNVYEIAANVHMHNVAALHFISKNKRDISVWDSVNYDYVTGHQSWKEFRTLLKSSKLSDTTRTAVFVPLAATQDGPFINKLLAGAPSAKDSGLYFFLFGPGAVQFTKQANPLDLFKNYGVVIGLASGTAFPSALGSAIPDMYFTSTYFYKAYDNPVNQYLIDAWAKRPHVLNVYGPHKWAYEGYTAMLAILNAVKQAGSTDTDAVIKALSAIKFDSPVGTVEFTDSNLLKAPVPVVNCKANTKRKFGYECTSVMTVPPSVTITN